MIWHIFGLRFAAKVMIHALTTFLFNGRSLRIDVIDRLVVQLLRRKVWLKDVCRHVCYSMSILLVYEGGGVGWGIGGVCIEA